MLGSLNAILAADELPPVVQANFASSALDYTTLSTLTSMPSGGSISRAGQAMLYDSTGKLTYAQNNLLTYSNTFTNAAWTTGGATIVGGQTDPNSGTTAYKLTEDTSTGTHQIYNFATISPVANAIVSIYAKAAGRSKIEFGGNWIFTQVIFDLSNGTISGGQASTGTITSVGNGWYRCSVLSPPTDTTNRSYVVRLNNGSTDSYTGDGTSGVYIWQSQLEVVTYQTTPSTYVATTSSAYYGPRFDYNPSTLAAKGLLIEGSRTNIQPYSQAFNNWTASTAQRASFNSVSTTQPDGTGTGYALVEDSTAGNHQGYYGSYARGSSSALPYVATVYAKSSTRRLQIQIFNGAQSSGASVTFDLVGGQIGVAAAVFGSYVSPSALITNAGNGWYRCSLTFTSDTNSSLYYFLFLDNGTGTGAQSNNYTGNGTSSINVFGAQLEQANFPTSYIPTTTASVTRAAETFAITGYSTNLIEAYYTDEATGNAYSAAYNAGTAPSTSYGWTTSLRPYTNAYAGSIASPSWIDNSGTTGNRMQYDSTGLLTWAPANVWQYSTDQSNAYWNQNLSITASSSTDPNGVTANTKFTASAGTLVNVRVGTYLTFSSGGNFNLYSFYFKAGSSVSYIQVRIVDNGGTNYGACINVSTQAVTAGYYDGTTTTTAVTSSFVQSVGGGWYRVSLVVPTNSSSIAHSIMTYFSNSATTTTNTWAGTEFLYLWGFQLEPVTYQTSARQFIPTTSAAVYNPRYDYNPSVTPATPNGMLIEESRTNILPNSNTLSSWSAVAVTATASSGISPDGTNNAWLVVPSTAATTHVIYQIGLTSGVYTASVYAKNSGINTFALLLNVGSNGATFNLSTGTFVINGSATATMTYVGNGWYRCTAYSSVAGTDYRIYIPTPSSVATGDGVSGALFYGAQLEAASFATSYIPTTSASVTRVADVVKLSGVALTTLQGSSLSISCEAKSYMSTNRYLVNARKSASGNYGDYYTMGSLSAGISAGSVSQASFTYNPAPTTTSIFRCAMAIQTNYSSADANGGTVQTNTTGSIPTGIDQAFLGNYVDNVYLNGWARSFAAYNTRLPDAVLKAKSNTGVPF